MHAVDDLTVEIAEAGMAYSAARGWPHSADVAPYIVEESSTRAQKQIAVQPKVPLADELVAETAWKPSMVSRLVS